jgi:hypothetical protein
MSTTGRLPETYTSDEITLARDTTVRVVGYCGDPRGPLGQLCFYAGGATFGVAGITPEALTGLRDACTAALAAMETEVAA